MTRPVQLGLLILVLGGGLAFFLLPKGNTPPPTPTDSGEVETPPSPSPAPTQPITPREKVLLTLQGVIQDDVGAPLAGASIEIEPVSVPGSPSATSPIARAESGADGTFQVDSIPPDFYRVSASREGYASRKVRYTLVAGQTLEPVVLQLVPGLTIRGIIRDALGAPLPDANVSAFVEGGSADESIEEKLLRLQNLEEIQNPVSTARSDAAGGFSLNGLADQPYRVRVRGPGHGLSEVRFVAAGTEDLEVSLTTGGAIEVTVEQSGGSAIAGAQVRILQLAQNPSDLVERVAGLAFPPVAFGETDDSGLARIDSLGGEFRLHVMVEAAGYQPVDGGELTLTPGETAALAVAMIPGETIQGIVRDPAGAPLEGARVRISTPTAETGNPLSTFPRPPIITGADGRFSRDDLPALPHLVSVFHEDFASTLRRNIQPSSESLDVTLKLGAVLSGTVIDAETEVPLDGANLRVHDMSGEPRTAVSSADGSFELRGLTAGNRSRVLVSAVRPGYEMVSGEPFVVVEGSSTSGQILPLRRNGSVRGFVIDADHNPIPDALLTAKRPIPGGLATVATITRSEADGSFHFPDVSPGTRTYLVGTHGQFVETRSQDFTVLSGSETVDVILTLQMGGDVRGRVIDTAGQPIPNAVIGVRGDRFDVDDPHRLPTRTRSAEDGSFILRRLPAGDLSLLVGAEGFVSVEVTGHEVIEARLLDGIEIKLDTGASLSGHVRDRSGGAIEGATVVVLDTSIGLKKFSTTSAEDGSFRFRELGPYPVEVEAQAKGHGKVRLSEQEVNRDDVVLVLESFGGLRGRVYSSSGEPLTSYNVSPRLLTEDGRAVPRVPSRSFTKDQFDFGGLVPGTYEVLIGNPNHAAVLLENITIRPRKFTELQSVTLTKGGEVSAVVFEEKSGFTLEGAEVKVLGGEENFHLDGSTGARSRRSTRSEFNTDKDGRFQIKGLYVDVVALEVWKSGFVRTTVEIPIGAKDHPIALAPGGKIQGTVAGPDSETRASLSVLLTPLGEGLPQTTLTDRRGNYQFTGLPEGEYKLEVTNFTRDEIDKGITPKMEPYFATVVGGETLELNLYHD